MSTIDDTLAERGARYGDFEGHAYLTQRIKEAMKEADGWDDLDPDMTECLEMVAHKIGRIINGDPEYVDSWTDIIGYVRLVEKRLIADHAALASDCAKVEAMEKDIDACLDETIRDVMKRTIEAFTKVEAETVRGMVKKTIEALNELEAERLNMTTDDAALAETVGASMQKAVAKFMADQAGKHNASQAKEPTNADIVKASLNVAAKQQEHKLVGDALKTLEKAGIIKEVRTHHDRFHVLFVSEESGEI